MHPVDSWTMYVDPTFVDFVVRKYLAGSQGLKRTESVEKRKKNINHICFGFTRFEIPPEAKLGETTKDCSKDGNGVTQQKSTY